MTHNHKEDLQKELAEIAVWATLMGDRKVIYSKKSTGLDLIAATSRPVDLQDVLETCMRINEN